MIVVNQQDLTQASNVNTTTTQTVPALTQQRIITQQIPTNANGAIEATRNATTIRTTNASQHQNATQVITPMGPLTLTPDEYNELMQRRIQKQAQVEVEVQRQQEAQQRAQQEAQQRAVQQQQLHQQQMQDHQNIAVQVQKIVQSLEEEVDGKKDDDDMEMQLIAPKMEVVDGSVHSEGTSTDHQTQRRHSKHDGEGKGAGRPFACEQCGKKFLLKHHLTTHSRVHTGKVNK